MHYRMLPSISYAKGYRKWPRGIKRWPRVAQKGAPAGVAGLIPSVSVIDKQKKNSLMVVGIGISTKKGPITTDQALSVAYQLSVGTDFHT